MSEQVNVKTVRVYDLKIAFFWLVLALSSAADLGGFPIDMHASHASILYNTIMLMYNLVMMVVAITMSIWHWLPMLGQKIELGKKIL